MVGEGGWKERHERDEANDPGSKISVWKTIDVHSQRRSRRVPAMGTSVRLSAHLRTVGVEAHERKLLGTKCGWRVLHRRFLPYVRSPRQLGLI